MNTFASLFFLFVCSISFTFAQPSSGTIFVGGDFGLSFGSDKSKNGNTTIKNYTSIEYSMLPQAGFFLSDNIALGARMGIDGSVTKYEDNAFVDKNSSSYFVISPFVRYYIINQKGGLFAQAETNLSFGTTKRTNNDNTNEDKSTNIFMGLRPGVYYYLSDRIVLQAFYGWLGFHSSRDKDGEDSKDINNEFGLNLNSNSLGFGFVYEF